MITILMPGTAYLFNKDIVIVLCGQRSIYGILRCHSCLWPEDLIFYESHFMSNGGNKVTLTDASAKIIRTLMKEIEVSIGQEPWNI